MRSLLDGMDIPPPRSNLAPPQPGYRSAAPAPDGMTRILVLAACGLGGLLAMGGAGWLVFGRSAAPVPMIEADSRPIRVKPDNPGGMQIAGAEEVAAGPQAMAPAIEAPAPQALRAQLNQPTHSAPRPAAVPAPVATLAPVAGSAPVATPASVAAPASPLSNAGPVTAARVPAPAPVTPAGRVTVQLGALETEAQGHAEWERLTKKLPVLAARQPQYQRAEIGGHSVWRIRTSGFADTAEATAFCIQVKAKGGVCSLAF